MAAFDAMNLSDLADGIRAGQRRALARGITLVESTHPDHRETAEALLQALLPENGGTLRLGLSGAPGVGKSSFIEAFGLKLIDKGHRPAVLAVDPSSTLGGGSILGDKTRMQELGRHPAAFVRPSPSGGSLGGVARRTREAMVLCEAAGFDVILVETVGVGQSEVAVASMVDMFILLLLPSGGDELQGLKRGIVELADLALVNKADGVLLETAKRTQSEYQNALRLLRPVTAAWRPPVLCCSALTGEGLDSVWGKIEEFQALQQESGAYEERRAGQASRWMWDGIRDRLDQALAGHPGVATILPEVEAAVRAGDLTPAAAVRRVLEAFGLKA